jgi:hypothetical protein
MHRNTRQHNFHRHREILFPVVDAARPGKMHSSQRLTHSLRRFLGRFQSMSHRMDPAQEQDT